MFIDLTGKKFGRLKVIELTKLKKNNRKDNIWKCICDCGKEVLQTTDYIKNRSKIPSCGCYMGEVVSKQFFKDLTGKKFTRLTVLNITGKKAGNGCYFWRCKCDCGSFIEAESSSLKSGNTKSCGCLHREYVKTIPKNIIGRIYGNLTVVNRAGSSKAREATWTCKCECGTNTIVSSHSLKSGHTKSCGQCLWKGETYLIKELNNYFLGILYFQRQGKPHELGQQRFDGYEERLGIAVEYNGVQHYKPVDYFGGQSKFKLMKKLDRRKLIKSKILGIVIFKFIPKKDDIEDLIQDIEEYLEDISFKQLESKCD